MILCGVSSVSILDHSVCEIEDLGTQFILSEEDVKEKRKIGEASLKKLRKLNCSVEVSLYPSKEIEKESLKKYDFVIFTNKETKLKDLIKYNEWCIEQGVKFIWSQVRGIFGVIFNDFGDKFMVENENGEKPKTGRISDISPNGRVSCYENHNLDSGDLVVINGVEGMIELDNLGPFDIEIRSPSTFLLVEKTSNSENPQPINLSKYGNYEDKGMFLQVKEPKEINFFRFKESFEDFETSGILEACLFPEEEIQKLEIFKTLIEFEEKTGNTPRIHDIHDAMKLIEFAKQEKKTKLSLHNEEFTKKLSFVASTEVSSVCSIIGGIVSQEVLKGITNIFFPIKQWYFFSESEKSLPVDFLEQPQINFLEENKTKYSNFIGCYGSKILQSVSDLRLMLGGCGSKGNEILKNFAAIGLATSEKGKLFVVDDSKIKVSDVSRNFLFKRKEIGESKCEISTKRIKNIESKMNIEFIEQNIGNSEEYKNKLNDKFYNSIDGVVNSLRNITSKLFICEEITKNQLFLVDCGCLGVKGNTQVVFPHITDIIEKSHYSVDEYPLSIVLSFPNKYEHLVESGKYFFQELFEHEIEQTNTFLNDPQKYYEEYSKRYVGESHKKFITLEKILIKEKCETILDCVKWSRSLFETFFNYKVKILTENFPINFKNKQNQLFWSGLRIFPSPVIFDLNDPLHIGSFPIFLLTFNFYYFFSQKIVRFYKKCFKITRFELWNIIRSKRF